MEEKLIISFLKAGHNKRWDSFTAETIKSQMGTILDEPEELKLPILEEDILADLPESFDSRV